VVEKLDYLSNCERACILVKRGYDVLLVGDGLTSTSDIQTLLEEAIRVSGLWPILLSFSQASDLIVPDGVTVLSYGDVDGVVHRLASKLGLSRRSVEDNRTVVFWTIKGGAGKTTCTTKLPQEVK